MQLARLGGRARIERWTFRRGAIGLEGHTREVPGQSCIALNFAGPPGTGKRAVLLFDEADAIAARRSTSVDHEFQRESNTIVRVLLQELEWFNGVVIFATNLAANFDPAFERRIRTHVLFEMPGEAERAYRHRRERRFWQSRVV